MLSVVLFALVFAPFLANAAIFPKGSTVKSLDAKGFKKAMEADQTSVVAFVAPWCGHCQRLAPEYSKASKSAGALLPFYAVDCDEEANKRLCGEQGVKGFPTIKVFPRGKAAPPMTYESGERTAGAIFNWASLRVPAHAKKLTKEADVTKWIDTTSSKNRALLLTKDKKVPLLWKVLAHKYRDQLSFGTYRDAEGQVASSLDIDFGDKKSVVLVFGQGSKTPTRYEGATKLEALSTYFDSVADGSAELNTSSHTPDEL